ncbi:hypothetical protein Pyn_25408 [Prunus yedoensis var. nudiflora]|uniref:Uncharacterized protein n=1 Tax=Prunus yedoensis var. nudiflora TaxID=2094558 RepID=A0A314Y574_PRUYE|nr:hypothetical protein Pyn_25408 [Prunus yedoensis var. nudiflora]
MGGALVNQGNVGRQVFWAESWQPRHDWDRSCRQAAQQVPTDAERSYAQRVRRMHNECRQELAQDWKRKAVMLVRSVRAGCATHVANRGQFVASG